MSRYNQDEYDEIFENPEFLATLDTTEKRAQYYWNQSTDFYAKGMIPPVTKVLKATCHVICTVGSHKLPGLHKVPTTSQRFMDLERRVVQHGFKYKGKRRKVYPSNVIEVNFNKAKNG